ncbi:MAG: folB [Ferruginibacter sp.]|nr:folB [Ferruginibacter sp.]
MFTIHLNDLRFFAHHGLHDEEAIVGTEFGVAIAINFAGPENIVSLKDTINYVEVYELVKNIFRHPARLLETLAVDICDAIYGLDHRIVQVSININKLNPPIVNFTGNVGVSFSKSF